MPKESNSSLSLLSVSLCSQWQEGTAAQGKGLLGFLNWLLEGNEVDGETEVDGKSQIVGRAADTLWASEPCQAPASPSLCQSTASGFLSLTLSLGDYHPEHLVSQCLALSSGFRACPLQPYVLRTYLVLKRD